MRSAGHGLEISRRNLQAQRAALSLAAQTPRLAVALQCMHVGQLRHTASASVDISGSGMHSLLAALSQRT